MTYWLSYGGGVNSTALAILLVERKLPQFQPWRAVWADTRDEKDETYAYVREVFTPYLARHGQLLATVYPKEGVLERWERLAVTGSPILRSCTVHAKIKPIHEHCALHGLATDHQLVGIDAGEAHRAKPNHPGVDYPKLYPLVDMGIDRQGCIQIIRDAGLPVPPKSGCWHCPFMRVGEVIALAQDRPDLFERIAALERKSIEMHPPPAGVVRAQWGDRPTEYWRERAAQDKAQGRLPLAAGLPVGEGIPCGCFDGDEE